MTPISKERVHGGSTLVTDTIRNARVFVVLDQHGGICGAEHCNASAPMRGWIICRRCREMVFPEGKP